MTRLDQCCQIISGSTPKTSVKNYWGGKIYWATPKDLSDLKSSYIDETPRTITEEGLNSCGAEVLPVNSVLFSSRAPIGHVAINRVPMATNQGFKSFIPDREKIDAGFLYYWLSDNKDYFNNLGNGATFKEVSKAIVSRVEIPLPPIDQQKRIAAILDKAEELRRLRRQSIEHLDVLTRSIFIEMFGDPVTNPKGWNIVTIRDLLESASYGTSEKAGSEGTFPILRMGNLTYSGEIDFTDLKFINLKASEEERYSVRSGDILFNRTNSAELVGKTAIYRLSKKMAYAGYLVRLRVNQKNTPEFVASFLNSKYAKRMLRGMCKSIIGMANINANEVQEMRIPMTPFSLQQEFAQRVEAIESLKAKHRESLTHLDILFASLQHRAFRGEL